jgi:hypothetical protein
MCLMRGATGMSMRRELAKKRRRRRASTVDGSASTLSSVNSECSVFNVAPTSLAVLPTLPPMLLLLLLPMLLLLLLRLPLSTHFSIMCTQYASSQKKPSVADSIARTRVVTVAWQGKIHFGHVR